MMTRILPSIRHTRQWRAAQTWYAGGRQNECELYQQQCVRQVVGHDVASKPTHLRLHLTTKALIAEKAPLRHDDGFEYTEDFDGHLDVSGTLFFFNLKFVCGVGGSQNRTMRETYHFVQTQLEHLVSFPDASKRFINILDGDCSHRFMPKFRFLLAKDHFQAVCPQVFVGDTHAFQEYWSKQVGVPGKMADKKKILGQFFTTRHDYILQGLSVPDGVRRVVEPFAGAGDLLGVVPGRCVVECYDIEPRDDRTERRDVLLDPPCFRDKFVLTNPPFLARNKCADKRPFDKHKTNDLYKCFLRELTLNPCLGGILIVPLNFWCSRREGDVSLRRDFLRAYRVLRLNIFEEPVFDDTDYAVSSFQFERRGANHDDHVPVVVFPTQHSFTARLYEGNSHTIGGEVFHLPRTHQYTITRHTRLNTANTRLVAKCIDDDKPIGLRVVGGDEPVYCDDTPNLSARSYATLVIDPPIPIEKQHDLADRFNAFLGGLRERHHSLFLPAYRENRRKRMPFDLLYHVVGHLLETATAPAAGGCVPIL